LRNAVLDPLQLPEHSFFLKKNLVTMAAPPSNVNCGNPAVLNGRDQLFCLIQDPFKAAVSHVHGLPGSATWC
jgi:hypothetical protein